MNVQNIEKLIRALESGYTSEEFNGKVMFDMETYVAFASDEDPNWWADFRGQQDTLFDSKECGTAACIAGHSFLLALDEVPKERRKRVLRSHTVPRTGRKFIGNKMCEAAARWLGIDRNEQGQFDSAKAYCLFEPFNCTESECGYPPGYNRIGRAEAVRVLRHLVATGKVDWSNEVAQYGQPF